MSRVRRMCCCKSQTKSFVNAIGKQKKSKQRFSPGEECSQLLIREQHFKLVRPPLKQIDEFDGCSDVCVEELGERPMVYSPAYVKHSCLSSRTSLVEMRRITRPSLDLLVRGDGMKNVSH